MGCGVSGGSSGRECGPCIKVKVLTAATQIHFQPGSFVASSLYLSPEFPVYLSSWKKSDIMYAKYGFRFLSVLLVHILYSLTMQGTKEMEDVLRAGNH